MTVNREYTREILEEAVANSTSVSGVLRYLDVRKGRAHARVSQLSRDFEIDTSHFEGSYDGGAGRTYPRHVLVEAVANSTSINGVLRYLDIPKAGGTHAHISQIIKRMDIDTSHFVRGPRISVRRKYTREVLQDAVSKSTSVAGVLRHLGLNQAGGTHTHISRTIRKMGLDTSHFVRYQNGAYRSRRSAGEILVRLPRGSRRTPGRILKRALDELGRPYECEACENDGTWQGQPLVLEVDHIDGDYRNNTAANLRYLCPNCHSLTDSFCGRNRGRYSRIDFMSAQTASQVEEP